MSWKDVICFCVVVVGAVLFLYGSNYYNAAVGWAGIYLALVGFLAETVLKVYEILRKRVD